MKCNLSNKKSCLAWEKECGPKKDLLSWVVVVVGCSGVGSLAPKAVQRAALAFQGVHNVHGGHGLPLGMLGVGDSITDNVLQENFQNAARLLVDQARDALDTATTSQTADSRLGDTLDVITQHLSVALGAPFPQTLSSFTTSRHAFLFH